jgi:hypothetical protein
MFSYQVTNKHKRFQASSALYLRPALRNIPEDKNPQTNMSLKPKIMPFQSHNKIEQEGTVFNNSD